MIPRATKDRQSVSFVRENNNNIVISYEKLKVWDAEGKVLPARLEVAENIVQLKVEEEGAVYPITVDPAAIPGPTYFKPGPVADNLDYFGFGIGISGDTMVISAPGDDGAGNLTPNAGAVYVFRYVGGAWALEATLYPSNPSNIDGFGGPIVGALAGTNVFLNNGSVAIDGDTIVVGAPFDDSNGVGVGAAQNNLGLDNGAAYVFTRTGTTWTQQAYLKASNSAISDWFGWDVDISGDTIVVGAPLEDHLGKVIVPGAPNEAAVPDTLGNTDHGAAYVFTRTAGVWTQQAYLKPPNVTIIDYYGASVAVDGDKIIVGAFGDDGGSTGANALPPATDYDFFSNPIGAISTNSGAAHVYSRAAGVWSYASYLKAFNIGTFNIADYFGYSVDISGPTAVVGALLEDSNTTGVNSAANELGGDTGAAYTYTMGAPWTNGAYLKANHHTVVDVFGKEVSINGTDVVVGAPGEDTGGNGINPPVAGVLGDSGAVYKFTGVAGTAATFDSWSKPTCPAVVATGAPGSPAPPSMFGNVEANQYYGNAVAVNMGTVGVGSPYEGATGTGVNPLYNLTGGDIGAAYIPGNCNMPPTIAAVPATVAQGATLTATTIGTALDAEDAENIVSVEISKDGGLTWSTVQTLNGVTVTLVDQDALALGVNPTAAGAIIANVTATCTATNASFLLRSIDSAGLISLVPAPLVVTVTPNTAPVLTYANVGANLGGVSTVNVPLTASDSTPILGTVYSLMSQGTYTGGVVVNPTTGVVTFTGQAPVGTHTIMVKANDGCLSTTAAFTITVKKMEVTISDPIVCSGPNNTVSVHAELLNGNATASAFNFTAPLAAPLAGVPGTCVSNFGACVITAAGVTVTGTLPANRTLIVDYKVIVANGTAPGTQLCINSVGKLDVNLDGTFDVTDTVMACTTLTCPPKVVNPKMSDQKAGSLLVFPYYNSKSGDNKDTQIMLSNTGDQEVFVHLFFIDGTNCGQADQLTCLTPNASLTFKTSEYDPETTGWLMAVAVDATGKPVQNNVLIGNAFVKDGAYVDNYGAESFWANSSILGTMNMANMTATLFFDGSSYDAMPNQFVAEIQSPLSVAGQRIVTVGMSGNLTTGSLSGAAQVGVGVAYNGDEKLPALLHSSVEIARRVASLPAQLLVCQAH